MANGRWVPAVDFEPPESYGSWVGLCEGQPACAQVGPDDAVTLATHEVDNWFERMTSRHGAIEIGGEWISRPWDLISKNGSHLERDFAAAGQVGVSNRHLTALALGGTVRSVVDS